MNRAVLKSIYDGVVAFNNADSAEKAVVAEAERARSERAREENVRRENQNKLWGETLTASSVGMLIESFDGLEGLLPDIGGQKPDSFRKTLSGNTLCLEYVSPQNTSWTGKLIEIGLSLSEGKENWNVRVLTEVTRETYTFQDGGAEFFRRVPHYESVVFPNDHSAYQHIEDYVRTHSCAVRLRGAIEKYFEGRKPMQTSMADALAPAA